MKQRRRTPEEIREAAARMLRVHVSKISQDDARRCLQANSLKQEDVVFGDIDPFK